MKQLNKNINWAPFLFWAGLLLVMLLRHFYFGLTYFNYLDDYNTYGIFYRRNGDIWHNIIQWYKLYTFRPLAFLADAYITQWFWPHMWLVLCFYTLMHWATCLLFQKIAVKNNLPFGALGLVTIALTPLLCEAVYWIGASTRLVPGMFLAILSGYLLMIYLDAEKNKKPLFATYALCHFLANGFYEQIVVFNFCFILVLLWLNRTKERARKWVTAAVPLMSLLFIGGYYIAFSSQGKLSQRSQLIEGPIVDHFLQTIKTIFHMITQAQWVINKNGLKAGITLINNPFQWAAFFLVCLFTLLTFYLLWKGKLFPKEEKPPLFMPFLVGCFLAITPFAPFFVLKDSYLYARAVYPAIFGIALALETGIQFLLPQKNKIGAFFRHGLAVVFIVPFFLIYTAEVNNYRLVEETDNILMANMLQTFESLGLPEETTIVLWGTKPLYPQTSSPRYENVTASDWSLIGKANSDSTTFYFRRMFAVPDGRVFTPEEMAELMDNSVFLGIGPDLSVFPLVYENSELFYPDREEAFGWLADWGDGYAQFTLYQ